MHHDTATFSAARPSRSASVQTTLPGHGPRRAFRTWAASLETDQVHWWYWMVTLGLIGAGFGGVSGAFEAVVALAAVQVVHYGWLRRSVRALAVQVRITALLLFSLGLVVPVVFAPLAVGLLARCAFNYCFAARVLKLMPWNRDGQALTVAYAKQVLLAVPSRGPLQVASAG